MEAEKEKNIYSSNPERLLGCAEPDKNHYKGGKAKLSRASGTAITVQLERSGKKGYENRVGKILRPFYGVL